MDIDKLCRNVRPDIRPQVETLAKAVEALQAKLEEQTSVYNNMPLAQMLTTTQGEKALKANPAVQEYRATIREYAQALDSLQELIRKNEMDVPYSGKSPKLTVVGGSRWKRSAS